MLFVNILIVYLILVPLAVLLHEIGHALGAVLLTKQTRAHVYLGPHVPENAAHFRLGRMHFYLRLATFGYCSSLDKDGKPSTEKMSPSQRIAFYAGGPVMSLIFALISLTASSLLTGQLFTLMQAFTIVNLFTFLSTSLPYIYPKWRRGLAGTPTDGLRIKRVWQNLSEERKQRRKAV
ncbi:M50 family metallopeptidase [Rossellomorea aquimaris]|uniref:M50 family metallopeptidase n=1 Tax=Rossellomorea TaxID=2837508 RepID=UPI001653D628|nr:M50 family metallopeptidase [Rossellomorea vietnamensis]